MSIKSNSITIRDENAIGANTASRVGGVLVEVADTLTYYKSLIDSNTDKTGISTEQANEIVINSLKNSYPSSDASKLSGISAGAQVNTINSTTTGELTGSDVITNIVSLTQAEYDAGTPISTTLYIIK
jgi:hypothetical protein